LKKITHLLEDFNSGSVFETQLAYTEEAVEDHRLDAFESGYQAGWDDASLAHHKEQKHISTQFSQNLQELNFTYHEAYTHILRSLGPLLTQITEKFLPPIAQETLLPRIVSEIVDFTRGEISKPIVITLSAKASALIERKLKSECNFPLQIEIDETLTDFQVYLKFSDSEQIIDIDKLINCTREKVKMYFSEIQRQLANG
jgi:hypothetical protein